MSDLKWNYLGCYKKNSLRPVLSAAPQGGKRRSQTECLNVAKNYKFFGLQTANGRNCYVGNYLRGNRVDDNECTAKCNPIDELAEDPSQGMAGCGSLEADPNKAFSVYAVSKSLMPKETRFNRNDIIIDQSDIGETYKNGLYKFSDSSHAFDWDAKRAFDSNANTYWMSPYLTKGPYNNDRSKNYTKSNYKQKKHEVGVAAYNLQQVPKNGRAPNGERFIIHKTEERKKDPTDTSDPIIHYGEWIQIVFPFKVFLTHYSIHPAVLNPRSPKFELARLPKHYVLMGSNGGGSWDTIDVVNENKYVTDLLEKKIISMRDIDNFKMPSKTNELGGATSTVASDKGKPTNYDTYRLIIKETHGFDNAAIGQLKFQGKVCISMDGDCDLANEDAIKKMRDSNISDLMEDFDNINDTLVNESFTNIIDIDNNKTNPLTELNIFNANYSKY